MIVVDSCGWIAWLVGDARADAYAEFLLQPESEVAVPTIVLFEVCRWVARQHGEQRGREVAALLRSRTVVALDDAVALLTVHLSQQYRLATADSLVYAHACQLRVELVTSDAAFAGLPRVRLVSA